MDLQQVFLIPDIDEKDIKIIGGGLKKLVVVVDAETFDDNGKIALDKMMTAIHYDPGDDLIKLIIPASSNFSISYLVSDYKDMIFFGFTPEKLGFNIEYKMYEIIHFDKSRLLICDRMSEIMAVQEKKKILWARLQEMFLNKMG